MKEDEKLLIAKCEDLFIQCDKYAKSRFSLFLNEAEQAVIMTNIGSKIGYNTCFFGGNPLSERKIFGVFPEWEEIDFSKFPIRILEISKKYKKELSHRDYLGTVMSKGIERTKIGDIVINDNLCYIYVMEDIADYLSFEIDKIANVGVKTRVLEMKDIEPPKPKFEIINTVSASLRLDAVVASVLRISRKNSSDLINAEKVSINHIVVGDTAVNLKTGDVISIRGFGKFIFDDASGKTRSDRLHIQVRKYI